MKDLDVIVKVLSGSRGYGMSTLGSDYDYRGIFIGPEKSTRTPFFTQKEYVDQGEEDSKLFELNHFFKLASENNPNVIELLYTYPADVIITSPAYQMLVENRDLFLSKKIAHTTSGYAFSQLKRIKGHNKWINNPVLENPKIQEYISLLFNFTEDKVFKFDYSYWQDGYILKPYGNDTYGLYLGDKGDTIVNEDQNILELSNQDQNGHPLILIKLNKKEFDTAKTNRANYRNWTVSRNQHRSSLEEKFGYDCKHASHLVRLLRMGKEALTEGTLHIRRPDAAELLAIRNGSMTYDEVVEYAEEMDREIKELYKTSTLQKSADNDKLADLLIKIQDLYWQPK